MVNININKDDFNLNDYLICFDLFGSRPNKIVLYDNYDPKRFTEIVGKLKNKNTDDNYLTEIIPGDPICINDKVFSKISESVYISYVHINRNSENNIIGEVNLFYKDKNDLDSIQSLIDKLNRCSLESNKNEHTFNKLNTLFISSGVLEIEPIQIKEFENFDDYYQTDTLKGIKKLSKKINKKEKGLSILWGKRGTGKTIAAKYIAEDVDRITIFIPNNMVDTTINNPDFKTFLRRHPKALLIIDDCETFFNEAYTKSNLFTNNMIQLVDGFLSDELGVQILLIFNADLEEDIDHSLLDCNNLISIIEFEYLDEESSQDLAKLLGIKQKPTGKNKIIDIINNRPEKSYKIGLN